MSKRVGPGRAQAQQPAVRLARAIVKPQHPEQWAEGNRPSAPTTAPVVPQDVLRYWSSQVIPNFLLGGVGINSAFLSRRHMKAIVDLFK